MAGSPDAASVRANARVAASRRLADGFRTPAKTVKDNPMTFQMKVHHHV
jgi:hypothetical protein